MHCQEEKTLDCFLNKKNLTKDLFNIKNNDNKFFLWCHIRHLNPLKIHPEKIAKEDKNMVNGLDYEGS